MSITIKLTGFRKIKVINMSSPMSNANIIKVDVVCVYNNKHDHFLLNINNPLIKVLEEKKINIIDKIIIIKWKRAPHSNNKYINDILYLSDIEKQCREEEMLKVAIENA